jgi:hypothetical protein
MFNETVGAVVYSPRSFISSAMSKTKRTWSLGHAARLGIGKIAGAVGL